MNQNKKQSKAFLMLASLLASICLWVYVFTTVNYMGESELRNIPITFVGEEEMLSDYDLIISEGADSTVSLTLYGRRSVLGKINKSNITAQVDLGTVKRSGENLALSYEIIYPDGVDEEDVTITYRDSYYVYLNVQQLETKNVEVRGVLDVDCEVAEGYVAKAFSFQPETIDIMGTSDKLALISHALVTVNRTNIDKTITDDYQVQLVTYEGEIIKDESITLMTDVVTATLPIAKTKDVPLVIEIIEGGGATGANLIRNIDPASITISGDAEIVDGVSQIILGTIDLNTITSAETFVFPITIPNEADNLSGVDTATVTVRLSGLETKNVTATQIEFINVPANYKPTALTQTVSVTVRASESSVENITYKNLRLVANLQDYSGAGRYEVPVKVYIDGYEDAGVLGEYSIIVDISAIVDSDAEDDEEASTQSNGVVIVGN